jgi:HEAT repeat protein
MYLKFTKIKNLLTAAMLTVSLGVTTAFAQSAQSAKATTAPQVVQTNSAQSKSDTLLSVRKLHQPFSLENDRLHEKELQQQERSRFAPEFNATRVRTNLKSADTQERLAAVEMVGYFPEIAQTAEVENLLLTDKSVEVRQQCAQTLQQIGDKKSIPTLVTALKDSNRDVRLFSTLALASLGEKEKSTIEAKALWNKGKKGAPLYSCHFIFRDLATPEAINSLATDLNNEDHFVAVDAAIMLAQIGQSAKAFPSLQQALNHADRYMRMAALLGLAYIGDSASLALIESKINDPDKLVRDRAVSIFKSFGIN